MIDYLDGVEAARDFFERTSQESLLYVSVVSVVELFAGKDTDKPEKWAAIETLLENFFIVELDGKIARRAGSLRRVYRQPFADTIIAASALHHGLSMVTRNKRDFEPLKKEFVRIGQQIVYPY